MPFDPALWIGRELEGYRIERLASASPVATFFAGVEIATGALVAIEVYHGPELLRSAFREPMRAALAEGPRVLCVLDVDDLLVVVRSIPDARRPAETEPSCEVGDLEAFAGKAQESEAAIRDLRVGSHWTPPPAPPPMRAPAPGGPPPRSQPAAPSPARARLREEAEAPKGGRGMRSRRPAEAPAAGLSPAAAAAPAEPAPMARHAPPPPAPQAPAKRKSLAAIDHEQRERAVGADAGAGASALADADDVAPAATLDRRATVRHYGQMNPGRTYPLLVVISEGRIERVQVEGVSQVESKQVFQVKRENPYVRIEPVLAGCAVAPTAIDLDVSKRVAEARFLVTPIVEGEIPEARVEMRYEGRVVDTVPIPSRIAKQTIAKLSAAASFVMPVTTKVLPFFTGGRDAEDLARVGALGAYDRLVDLIGGTTNLTIASTGVLLAIAFVFYLRNRAKEADPVERFFDYATAGRAPEDLAVTRRQQRLVVLADGERRACNITEPDVAIGGDPGAAIFLRDASVRFHHAALRFDGHAFRVARASPQAHVEVEGRPIEEALLPDREALITIGRVQLWAYRAASDPALDAPEARSRLLARLCDRVRNQADAIREAFDAGAASPLRETIARLLVQGAIDVSVYREACAAERIELLG